MKTIFSVTAFSAALLVGGTNAATASGLLPARALNSYATRDNYNPNDQRPCIATDGMGNWLSMWNVSEATSQYYPKTDLEFASSTTSGTTWGAPVIPDLLPGRSVISADLAYAGNGKWVAMWISEVDHDLSNRQAGFSISDDLGQTWSAPQALPPQDVLDTRSWRSLQLASDNAGNLVAVWLQQGPETTTYKILTTHSSDSGQTWAVPIELSGIDSHTTFNAHAQIAYAGDGQWVTVYTGKRILYGNEVEVYSAAKSSDFGANWADIGPLFMGSAGITEEAPFALEARNGKVVVAAISPVYPRPEDVSTDGVEIFVSDDSLTTFPTSFWVETAEVNATGFVTVAADDSGSWLLAARAKNPGHTVPESPATNPVLFWRSTDPGTTWTATAGPATDGVNSYMQLAGAGAGDFVMVMEHFGPPETLADADVDIQAVATGDNASTWYDLALVNSPDPADLALVQDSKVDMEAGDGVIIACWLAQTGYPPGINYPYTGIDPVMISRSVDDGRSWSPAVPLPGDNVQNGLNIRRDPPAIRYKGGNTWECTWLQRYPDANYKQSSSTDGGITWSVPVIVSEPPPARNKAVAVSPQGNGVRVSSTTINPSSGTNIYTLETHVETSSDGGITWSAPVLIYSETFPGMAITDYTGDATVVHAGSGRFAILIKNIYSGRDLPLDSNRLQAVNVYLCESYDNGHSWRAPETVLQSNRLSYFYETPFVESNNRLIIGWSERNRAASTGPDEDIFFRAKEFGATNAARNWSLYQ